MNRTVGTFLLYCEVWCCFYHNHISPQQYCCAPTCLKRFACALFSCCDNIAASSNVLWSQQTHLHGSSLYFSKGKDTIKKNKNPRDILSNIFTILVGFFLVFFNALETQKPAATCTSNPWKPETCNCVRVKLAGNASKLKPWSYFANPFAF